MNFKNKLKNRIKCLIREESGAVSLLFILGASVFLGCGALVLDLGAGYTKGIRLQNAVDNAAWAAGTLLPAENSQSGKADVISKAESSLCENGFDPGELEISYSWEENSSCCYGLRITAEAGTEYGFARIFGETSGRVKATAKISAIPLQSTLKAISIYIKKTDFEAQLESLSPGENFTISISTSGTASNSLMNLGIIRIVTDSDKSNYASFEGITSPRDSEFFETGYYGMNSDGTKCGLAVGNSRVIENNSSIYSNSYTGMLARINSCSLNCASGCCAEHHSNSCPRIALLPVVTAVTASGSGRNYGSGSNGTATVEYFVAIYVESVTKTSRAVTISASLLDDYREVSDVDSQTQVNINPFTVCTAILSE